MVTFHCMLQKKLGEQDVLVAPPIILLRSSCSPCSPGSRACAYLANILFVCVCVKLINSLRVNVVGIVICYFQKTTLLNDK